MRGALAALVLVAGGAEACTLSQSAITAYPGSVTSGAGLSGPVHAAWFDDPVTRYDHFVLGRAHEPSTLWVDAPGNQGLCGTALTLGAPHVFEDTAPRLADLDGDGTAEVVVVRSHEARGAQIAVYRFEAGALSLAATTPYIGERHRWLAPVAVADLDGDGAMEIAYVDRPHLDRTLRVWRWQDGSLIEVAAAAGVTNHRIGDPSISGGLRDCGNGSGPEMILASGDWLRLLALRLVSGRITATDFGPWSGPAAEAVLACR